MGFFDFLKQANINQGIEEYKRTAGAVLLDVRTPQEYQEGHIPESKNVPLQQPCCLTTSDSGITVYKQWNFCILHY